MALLETHSQQDPILKESRGMGGGHAGKNIDWPCQTPFVSPLGDPKTPWTLSSSSPSFHPLCILSWKGHCSLLDQPHPNRKRMHYVGTPWSAPWTRLTYSSAQNFHQCHLLSKWPRGFGRAASWILYTLPGSWWLERGFSTGIAWKELWQKCEVCSWQAAKKDDRLELLYSRSSIVSTFPFITVVDGSSYSAVLYT